VHSADGCQRGATLRCIVTLVFELFHCVGNKTKAVREFVPQHVVYCFSWQFTNVGRTVICGKAHKNFVSSQSKQTIDYLK